MTDTAPIVRRRSRRGRYAVVAVLCGAAIIWMVVLMQRNVVFFKTVSQAVKSESHQGTRTFRIGGGVVPGSIADRDDGVDFRLTEGGATVLIHHTGTEPQLFKPCAPVVAEGHWDATATSTFDSTRLLIKHDNNYEAPKDAGGQCPADPFK
ncbi:MAG TPA: cytochrome c maturation protein CcmE [Acidimicrobiia bacterium]|nr:cytochrome c maturation protein CcmE [Acidimicrobiia bacterium]